MTTRRDFLGTLPLISLAATVPGFLARTARAASASKDDRVLVVIQLDGGNDGINTVVPFRDHGYAKHRKTLRIPDDKLLKIADGVGLNPSMTGMAKLVEAGRMAVVQGVGYPNPSRSHFASMATWHTARLDPEDHSGFGWLGRGLDLKEGASAAYVGSGSPPVALRSRRSATASLERIEDFRLDPAASSPAPAAATGDDLVAFARRSSLDAYAAAGRMAEIAKGSPRSARYPDTDLGRRLKLASQLLKGGFAARVFYANQGGYDTHTAQLNGHGFLLGELSGAVKAFLDDLDASGLNDRVAVLVFSEFGRRVAENASGGTDHGTAGPVFLAGSGIRGGLFGVTPSLTDLEDGDLKSGLDFRRVYATLLESWLGIEPSGPLGGDFETLPLIRG